MQLSEYENIYKNEGSHFFYVANHHIILTFVKKYLKTPRMATQILDAGCGTGLLAKKLGQFGKVSAIDISPEAIRFSKKRGVQARQGSINKIPFGAGTFDLVVSMDVLYHKKVDDKNALREFYRVLKPGGVLILRVSANKWLSLNHDKHVHARQRYSMGEVKNKTLKAGFKLEKVSYVNMVLLPLAIVKQFIETIIEEKETVSGVRSSGFLNTMLLSILSIEPMLISHINLPFGLGIVVVGRK